MAKIKEITVSLILTVNLGDFNSAKIGHSIVVELDKDDDIDDIREETYKDIKQFLENKIEEL